MPQTFYKDPNDTERFTIDWSSYLASTDSVSSSSWTVPSGISSSSESNSTQSTTIKLIGGTAGTRYVLSNRIVTGGGQTISDSITLILRESSTPDSIEPVTLQQAKDHLYVDIADHDDYIKSLITAARKYAEVRENRALTAQTLTEKLPRFPYYRLTLDRPPLRGITSITYYDASGSTQTLSSTGYQVNTHEEPGYVVPAVNATWPSTQVYRENAVTVTYTAGYATPEAVPETTRQAILLMVAHWFEQRQPVVSGSMGEVPLAAEALLACDAIPRVW